MQSGSCARMTISCARSCAYVGVYIKVLRLKKVIAKIDFVLIHRDRGNVFIILPTKTFEGSKNCIKESQIISSISRLNKNVAPILQVKILSSQSWPAENLRK